MTLREHLKSIDRTKIFEYIFIKDSQYIAECDRPTMEKVVRNYSHVIDELLSKPIVPPYKYPIVVRMNTDWYDGHEYLHSNFKNLSYEPPPENLKPFYSDKNHPQVPDGFYDANDEKYIDCYGFGMEKWSVIIDCDVLNESGKPIENAIGEILWELTFHGWTEKKAAANVEKIMECIEESIKTIDNSAPIDLKNI